MTERLLALLAQQALLLTVAIALLWALRPLLLKRLGAGAAHAFWLLVPALLLTPMLPRPAQEPLRVALQAAGAAPAATLPGLPAPDASQAPIWLTLWLAGTLGLLLFEARAQWRLARLGARLPAGSSPALVGLLRPRIALPADFEARFTAEQRELILAHEEAHRARHDNAWNLLACVLTALHWWNPLAWWARRRLRADQELACDAAVLASRPAAAAAYARALLAAHGLDTHGAPLASRWRTTHPLVERMSMLKLPRPLTHRGAGLLAAMILGSAGLAYAAQAGTGTTAAAAAATDALIEIKLDIGFDDGTGTRHASSPRLITHNGQPVIVGLNNAPSEGGAWEVVMFPKLRDDGQLEIVTTFRDGQPLQGHAGTHTQVTRPGEPFKMRVGAVAGGAALVMTRSVALLPPAAIKPPR